MNFTASLPCESQEPKVICLLLEHKWDEREESRIRQHRAERSGSALPSLLWLCSTTKMGNSRAVELGVQTQTAGLRVLMENDPKSGGE